MKVRDAANLLCFACIRTTALQQHLAVAEIRHTKAE